jgi:hypothetical protein
MSRQDKAIGYILLAHSTLGLIWAFWVAAQTGFPVVFLVSNICLAALGVAAGTAIFRQHTWAIRLSVVFYLAQLLHLVSPVVHWSFTLGLSFVVTFGVLKNAQIGVNLYALGMLFWLSARAVAPNYSSKPTP